MPRNGRKPPTPDNEVQALWRAAEAQPGANALTADIIAYLWSLNVYAWRNNTGRRGGIRFGKVGSGDILGVLPGGRALSIEVKAGRDQERDEQAKFRCAISTLGALAFVARSLDEVKLVMRGEGLDRIVRVPSGDVDADGRIRYADTPERIYR